MRRSLKQKVRSAKGDSLISLLVATLIFSFVAMAIMGMLTINVVESNKLMTRTDNISGARFGADRIGRIVRMARSLGDIQGNMSMDAPSYAGAIGAGVTTDWQSAITGTDPTFGLTDGANIMSAAFPSAANPYYPTLTNFPSNWGNPPYRLGSDTLVVQVPVFDTNGWPRANAYASGGTTVYLPMTDTYVFKVVKDDARTQANGVNFYQLQMAIWPARGQAGVSNTNMPAGMTAGKAATLISGIVGPLDPTDPTKVAAFQYVHRNNSYSAGPVDGPLQTNFIQDGANEQELGNFVGVMLNIQLMSQDAAHRASVMPLRTEMYLRNNSQASCLVPRMGTTGP